jgi:uncharacterized protein YybS (DUF2232 family)
MWMLIAMVFLTISGFLTLRILRKFEWQQNYVLKIRLFHGIFGYLFLLVGLIVCVSGIVEYFQEVKPILVKPLCIIDVICTLIALFAFEYYFRK